MDYSLIDHNKAYQYSISDGFYSVITGFSGVSYAQRHYQMSKADGAHLFGHRLIAYFEYMPLIGGVVALIERIAVACFLASYSPAPWRQTSNQDSGMIKSALEHERRSTAFAKWNDIQGSLKNGFAPLKFEAQCADALGPRDQMEDAKFTLETDKAFIAGVFDGHGGKEVSSYASEQFGLRFHKVLKQCKGDVPLAMQTLIHRIHQDVVSHSRWNSQGSTAVISYIDKTNNKVYTATLGDSEANIYRKFGFWSAMKSIPLSIVRDWASPKDRARLDEVHGKGVVDAFVADKAKRLRKGLESVKGKGDIEEQVNKYMAKGLRSQLDSPGSVNVSRAIGDVDQTGTPDKPLVIHKPKITISQVQSGDVLVLACDGLKDYASESSIVDTVSKGFEGLTKNLVDLALSGMGIGGGDNVTAIAIKVS